MPGAQARRSRPLETATGPGLLWDPVSCSGLDIRMPRASVTLAEIVIIWSPSSVALSMAVMVRVSMA